MAKALPLLWMPRCEAICHTFCIIDYQPACPGAVPAFPNMRVSSPVGQSSQLMNVAQVGLPGGLCFSRVMRMYASQRSLVRGAED